MVIRCRRFASTVAAYTEWMEMECAHREKNSGCGKYLRQLLEPGGKQELMSWRDGRRKRGGNGVALFSGNYWSTCRVPRKDKEKCIPAPAKKSCALLFECWCFIFPLSEKLFSTTFIRNTASGSYGLSNSEFYDSSRDSKCLPDLRSTNLQALSDWNV